MPNPSLFPFDSVTIKLKNSTETIELSGEYLEKGLQYSPSVRERPSTSTRRVLSIFSLSTQFLNNYRSQDGLDKAFDMLCNEGDYLITENPTYSGALASLHPLALKLVGIDTDQYGIIPSALEKVLSTWDFTTKPLKAMYIIPTEDDPYYNLQLYMNNQPPNPGMRTGWVTGPKYLVERIQLHQQANILHPSGFSQVVLLSVLKKWGKEGWQKQ
ncbi:hypothetical protein HMI54_011737, partial [Coelomomyces lativittatus]